MPRFPFPLAFGCGLLAGAGTACTGGGLDFVTPPPPPSAGFTVTLRPGAEDAAVAQALGWGAAIPDADVVLTPADSSSPPRMARTDPSGIADFGQVPAGPYLVESHRWLSPTERAQVAPGESVNGWVAGARVTAGPGGGGTVTAVASRRPSLVISEWAFNAKSIPGLGSYLYGGYLELYNNADTTVYLDGITVGAGYVKPFDTATSGCAVHAYLTNDPDGVWSIYFFRFPGAGRDQPLAPGETALVATDAIDHRPLFPGALDLRNARFELAAQPDVDNPAVPDAIEVGPLRLAAGHGLTFTHLAAVLVVARSFDTAGTVKQRTPNDRPIARIDAADVVDVLAIGMNYLKAPGPECPRHVHPNFDREPSHARGTVEATEYDYSLVRRATDLTPGGRPVLQHTRTGALDFVRSLRTPGRYP